MNATTMYYEFFKLFLRILFNSVD